MKGRHPGGSHGGREPDHENPWGLFSLGWVASWIVGTLAVANDPHLNLGRFSLWDYLLFLAIFDGPVLAIEAIDRRRRRARYNRGSGSPRARSRQPAPRRSTQAVARDWLGLAMDPQVGHLSARA